MPHDDFLDGFVHFINTPVLSDAIIIRNI